MGTNVRQLFPDGLAPCLLCPPLCLLCTPLCLLCMPLCPLCMPLCPLSVSALYVSVSEHSIHMFLLFPPLRCGELVLPMILFSK